MNEQAFTPEELDAELLAGIDRELSRPPPARRAPLSPGNGPEIQTVSHVHENIINWMILHPQRSLRDCAEFFGYTQSWLSTMIHSGCFQARLKSRQDEVFSQIAGDLHTKLAAGADVGVTKLNLALEKSEDPAFILKATATVLEKLGFGSALRVNSPGIVANNVQQNFYMASAADLAAARGVIHAPAAEGREAIVPVPRQLPDA